MPSIEQDENAASEKLFPQLKEHLNYANDAYNLAFKVQSRLEGKKQSDLPETTWAQLMILMRITDFLRSIQLLAIKGYPEQAGALAASIFELAHTAMFFVHSPDKAIVWLEADSIKEQVPRRIFQLQWNEVVEANCRISGNPENAQSEYRVYKQLCWLKHSLPKMQDMRMVANYSFELIFGPHTDERAINHAWFSLEHAGRLTEMAICLVMDQLGDAGIEKELQSLTESRALLKERAIERFGDENPFEIDS